MAAIQETPQFFLVTCSVIEGRHYIWSNISSFAQIKIDNHMKQTKVQDNTESPFYNEYFVFEYNLPLSKLLEKKITFTVIRPGGFLRRRKILGLITIDVRTVWYEPDHQCYHKWAILSAPAKDIVGGTRGYLKIDINILAKGEGAKIPPVTNTDDIEGNLLLPMGTHKARQKVHFVFTIYQGEDLMKKISINENSLKSDTPTTHIEVSFGNTKIRTEQKKGHQAVWNEQLIIPELFPPLWHRFQIQLHINGNSNSPTRYLNLNSVSNNTENGFLPTFGPAFIHFYSSNKLEGILGKVLISLHTQLTSDYITMPLKAKSIPLSLETPLQIKTDNIILHATIFEVSSIKMKYCNKPISFRLAWGALKKEHNTVTISPSLPEQLTKNMGFLNIYDRKPCFYLTLTIPDLKKRMYLFNMLIQTQNQLKTRLDEIEDFFELKSAKVAKAQTDVMIVETMDFLLSTTTKYIDIATTYDFSQFTDLERERYKLSIIELIKIQKRIKSCYCLISRKKIFQALEKMLMQLEMLTDDLEDWSDIYIWMISGSKRVAYFIVPAKSILYSPIIEEQGPYCGIVTTIFFRDINIKTSKTRHLLEMCAKMDLLMWLGSDRHFNNFLTTLPKGFTSEPADSIPHTLVAQEQFTMQSINHVYQARMSGKDSRTYDTYVSVTLGCSSDSTQVLKNTLNPLWEQTLSFSVTLYGSKEFIKSYPPSILIDVCEQNKVLGRYIVKPFIKMKGEVGFASKLIWYQMYSQILMKLELLAAFEINENELQSSGSKSIVTIPASIKPHMINHRIEVLLWGVRQLKNVKLLPINKPKIVLECLFANFECPPLPNANKCLNYPNPVVIFETNIADEIEFSRCITMKMYDCRCFGMNVFAGTHIFQISDFFIQPLTLDQRAKLQSESNREDCEETMSDTLNSIISNLECKAEHKRNVRRILTLERFLKIFCCFPCNYVAMMRKRMNKRKKKIKLQLMQVYDSNDDEDCDWWTKFYASLRPVADDPFGERIYRLAIYNNELENQPQFHKFEDILHPFPMYRGRKTGDQEVDDLNTIAVFKGALKIYRWPLGADYVTSSGLPIEKGVFQDFPSNQPMRFYLRVYIVRAINLRPKDLNGNSDPYLYLTLNNQVINDNGNVVHRQTSPVFGRMFEFNGYLPEDHMLTVALYDWDAASNDDFIGETTIDLENRFYTKHRGHCGLSNYYKTSGYCEWRDPQKPDHILEELCRSNNLPPPEYSWTSVRVSENDFGLLTLPMVEDKDHRRQILALNVLRRWREIPVIGCELVPEHVETRSLYDPRKPGVEQGKLQMWLDLFPMGDLPPPAPVNIKLRVPKKYELRVIVWNCEKLHLGERDLFTREKKADIFVKGWMAHYNEAQMTDVHYRTFSGEGNFNWRFIFKFDYLSTENKLIYLENKALEIGNTEIKVPCGLHVQIWDYDAFTSNDFLASLTLELSHLPRGAAKANLCNMKIMDGMWPEVNLFKIGRMRGWWPLKSYCDKTKKQNFAGCIELEFELLSLADAEKKPVGLGRQGPNPLPLPVRPDWSFSYFQNPLATIKYIAKANKWKTIRYALLIIIIIGVLIGLYAIPGDVVHTYLF